MTTDTKPSRPAMTLGEIYGLHVRPRLSALMTRSGRADRSPDIAELQRERDDATNALWVLLRRIGPMQIHPYDAKEAELPSAEVVFWQHPSGEYVEVSARHSDEMILPTGFEELA